jgi:RhtB (resistance to homoserine/threonine) family protein
MTSLWAFLGVSILVIVTPGPDTAITIRNALFGGRPGGIFTALGIACGQVVWALATSLGIVALLIASEPLFLAVKYAGAAYLIYLGAVAIRDALRRSHATREQAPSASIATRLRPQAAFRHGLISDLSNPKMAVFFASLLPQFVAPGEESFAAFMALGLIFAIMTFVWLALYSLVIARAGDWLRRPAVRRTIEGVTGALLVGLGVRLAAEQR